MYDKYYERLSTKERIYITAAKLFEAYGYNNVSIRDIAKKVGITNPAIYNHFKTKKDILSVLYEVFKEQRLKYFPSIESVVEFVEKESPSKIFDFLNFQFPSHIANFMNSVLTTAIREISTDIDSLNFIKDVIMTDEFLKPALKKMIELKKIEPIDTELFIEICVHYAFSAVALNATPLKFDLKKWKRGLDFLYSFAMPKT